MAAILLTSPADALGRLSAVLGEYQRTRGQTALQVLNRAGLNVSLQLYQAFADTVPAEGAITAAAKARDWRLGRHDPEGLAGISPTAAARARAKLQGYPSILAYLTTGGAGRIRVDRAVTGRRGRLVRDRVGRGRYAHAISGALTYDQARVYGTARARGAKILNFRALATIEEINLRESGRRFLAISWLYRRWRTLAGSDARRGDGTTFRVLQNANPRSRLAVLGTATLEGSPANNAASLTLTSRVPGVQAVGTARGLFARALNAVSTDMGNYARQLEVAKLGAALRGALQP